MDNEVSAQCFYCYILLWSQEVTSNSETFQWFEEELKGPSILTVKNSPKPGSCCTMAKWKVRICFLMRLLLPVFFLLAIFHFIWQWKDSKMKCDKLKDTLSHIQYYTAPFTKPVQGRNTRCNQKLLGPFLLHKNRALHSNVMAANASSIFCEYFK